MDREKRIQEINKLMDDEKITPSKARILLEELAELKLNVNIVNNGTLIKICERCRWVKRLCFFDEPRYKGYPICRRCVLIEKEAPPLKIKSKIYCKECDCILFVTNKHAKKFIVRAHNATQKHKRNVVGNRKSNYK